MTQDLSRCRLHLHFYVFVGRVYERDDVEILVL